MIGAARDASTSASGGGRLAGIAERILRAPAPAVLAIVGLGWAAALAYSMLASRVLYGDGSLYVLVHLITPHRFDDYDAQRTFASLITQAPILFGERLGFDSVRAYAALYALGVFVLPAAALFAALLLGRRQPFLFAALAFAAAFYGFGSNYINTESNLLSAFAWLCIAIIAADGPHPILRGVLLPFIALALMRTYEGMLLVGPLLAAWAFLAASRLPSDMERFGLRVAGLLFALGAVIGLGGFLAPRDPENATSFVQHALQLLANPQGFLLACALLGACAIVAARPPVRMLLAGASAAAGAAFIVALLRLEGYYAYEIYSQNRAFMVLALPFAVGALLLAYWRAQARWYLPGLAAGWAAALIPFAAAAAGDAIGTHRWNLYMDDFCHVLASDLTPAERMKTLRDSGALTGWKWSHPTLSVLLRGRAGKGMVINEAGSGWEPFDPRNAPAIGQRGLCEAPSRRAGS
jgi:hypothetical protein